MHFLQAFNWESANSNNWWEQVERAAPQIAAAGFSVAWLPPPTQSVSRQVQVAAYIGMCPGILMP
jgi:hypothetical protein